MVFVVCMGEGGKLTARHRPVKLVYWKEFYSVLKAFEREHQVKKWSRKKKMALIKRDSEALEKLAVARWKLKR